jgi:hypothetical protein
VKVKLPKCMSRAVWARRGLGAMTAAQVPVGIFASPTGDRKLLECSV